MNVSKVQARKLVLVSSFALIAISVYRNRSNETAAGTFKRLWATGIVALMLSLLADFAPAVAGPFAVLTVLGWLVKDGTQIIDNALGGSAPATPGKTPPNTKTTTNASGGTTTATGP